MSVSQYRSIKLLFLGKSDFIDRYWLTDIHVWFVLKSDIHVMSTQLELLTLSGDQWQWSRSSESPWAAVNFARTDSQTDWEISFVYLWQDIRLFLGFSRLLKDYEALAGLPLRNGLLSDQRKFRLCTRSLSHFFLTGINLGRTDDLRGEELVEWLRLHSSAEIRGKVEENVADGLRAAGLYVYFVWLIPSSWPL